MKKVAAISMAALILVLVPLTLGAQEAKGQGKMMMPGERFGLDEKTHAVISELMVDYRMKSIDLGAEIKKLRLQIHREWMSEEPSREKLNKMTQQMSDLRVKMKKNRIAFLFEAKKNLTDEQWKMFRRHHQRMGRGHGMKGREGRMDMRCGRARGGCGYGHGDWDHSRRGGSCLHGREGRAGYGRHLHRQGEFMFGEDDDDEDLDDD